MAEELVENPLKATLVLAFADEAAQLPLERRPVAGVLGVLDLRNSEVRDVALGGVDGEDIAVGQRHRIHPLVCSDEHGVVVPAVAPVEQAVVVLLDFAGEEDEQAAGDEILDSIDRGRTP